MDESQKKELLCLAREAIESEFSKQIINLPTAPRFNEQKGLFVTLHMNGELRGCIGFPLPIHTITQGIIKAAKAASFDDPRFDALTKEELSLVKIEISLLSKPAVIRVMDPDEYEDNITIGRDGLYVRSDKGSGLLLPQVFTEYNCNWKQALQMTCQKAGLENNAWQDLSVKVYTFQSEIFSEN